MRKWMDFWKMFAIRMPRIYMYVCWLLIGLAGITLRIGLERTVLGILILGYFINIIWMMRQSK